MRSKLITQHRQSRQFLLWQAAQPITTFNTQNSTLRTAHNSTLKTQHYALLHRPKPIQSYPLFLAKNNSTLNNSTSAKPTIQHSTLKTQHSHISLHLPPHKMTRFPYWRPYYLAGTELQEQHVSFYIMQIYTPAILPVDIYVPFVIFAKVARTLYLIQ